MLEPLRGIVGRPAFVGLIVVVVFVLAALAAPILAPNDPNEMHATDRFLGPGPSYLLGTDEAGRDLLSRMLFGARISTLVAAAASGIAVVVGVPLGVLAGYRGGIVDDAIMRVLDGLLAIPGILIALTLVTALGPGIWQVIVAIGVYGVPLAARIARASVLTELTRDYVLATRAAGARGSYIATRVLLPNILSPVIVTVSLLAANAILLEAALSFLGFGPRPPDASWGSLLQSGYRIMGHTIWLVTWPGIAIFLFVWSLNVLGDALRDTLDPRLRGIGVRQH